MSTSKKMYMVNGIQCPSCREKLWSKHRHDFHYCGCGYCFVDGGADYLRYGWGVQPKELGITDRALEIPAEIYSEMSYWTDRIGIPEAMSFEVPADQVPESYKRIKDGKEEQEGDSPRWPY